MKSLDDRYDMILGQPFRKAMRSTIGYDEGGNEVMCFTDPETGGEVLVRPCKVEDLAERGHRYLKA
jgi:hypothetical protein